jgi:hypothetical protein
MHCNLCLQLKTSDSPCAVVCAVDPKEDVFATGAGSYGNERLATKLSRCFFLMYCIMTTPTVKMSYEDEELAQGPRLLDFSQ